MVTTESIDSDKMVIEVRAIVVWILPVIAVVGGGDLTGGLIYMGPDELDTFAPLPAENVNDLKVHVYIDMFVFACIHTHEKINEPRLPRLRTAFKA